MSGTEKAPEGSEGRRRFSQEFRLEPIPPRENIQARR